MRTLLSSYKNYNGLVMLTMVDHLMWKWEMWEYQLQCYTVGREVTKSWKNVIESHFCSDPNHYALRVRIKAKIIFPLQEITCTTPNTVNIVCPILQKLPSWRIQGSTVSGYSWYYKTYSTKTQGLYFINVAILGKIFGPLYIIQWALIGHSTKLPIIVYYSWKQTT